MDYLDSLNYNVFLQLSKLKPDHEPFLEHIQLHPNYHYHPCKQELHQRTQYHPSEHVTLQNIWQIFSLKNISTSFVASILLSSADICTSSSDLNFSVVHCKCVCDQTCIKFSRETPNFRGGLRVHSKKFESSKWV